MRIYKLNPLYWLAKLFGIWIYTEQKERHYIIKKLIQEEWDKNGKDVSNNFSLQK